MGCITVRRKGTKTTQLLCCFSVKLLSHLPAMLLDRKLAIAAEETTFLAVCGMNMPLEAESLVVCPP